MSFSHRIPFQNNVRKLSPISSGETHGRIFGRSDSKSKDAPAETTMKTSFTWNNKDTYSSLSPNSQKNTTASYDNNKKNSFFML